MMFSARRPRPEQMPKEKGWFSLPDPEELEKELVEPPMEDQLKSNKFMPYEAVLPVYDMRHLSYTLPTEDLNNLRTFTTRLESTS